MVFSSTVFLFVFLPAVLTVYFLAANSLRNALLLLASLIFYAWGEPKYVLLMIGSIIFNYIFGILIDRVRAEQRKQKARLIVFLAVFFNLSLLGFYKYAHFVVDQLNPLLKLMLLPPLALEPIDLPIGISFFTFQAISYIVDVYRNEGPAQKNPFNLALYIALFPQLIAGPIVRYHHVAAQIISRRITLEGLYLGIRRFTIGLAKKILIANTLGSVADQVFALGGEDLTTGLAWIGILCYALQIYFDFSGYSDMAIGLGRMFGFTFPENFNYPYISKSIKEFWRRWHISLSSWFRDYVYIPLGGNRRKPIRVHLNLVLVFLLTGLWHGASWNFVIWGLFHGIFLLLERTVFGRVLEKLWFPFRNAYALLVVLVGWVFFRADDVPHALYYLKAMFGFSQANGAVAVHLWNIETVIAFIAGIVISLPIIPSINRIRTALSSKMNRFPDQLLTFVSESAAVIFIVFIFTASAMKLASSTYNPFIYFRF
jgi:alginate O-acetyltransferase complex protein AlgI